MKTRMALLVGLFFCISLVLTGCTDKKESKLVCTMTQSGVDIEFVTYFKGNTVEDIKFSYDMNISSYTDSQIEAIGQQDFCTSVKSAIGSYGSAFEKCSQKINDDKHLVVSASLNPDKLDGNGFNKNSTRKEAKKAIEEQGYTCEE